ncbi:MAG: glucose 1-dehydrogenase [Bryobacterales bacterium]|nr:glucose 1-dehydrogenase [Bryobacterales bacterium]MEB2363315.1 glucose 1-dehydrogenase [Bryobacterales bacterium]
MPDTGGLFSLAGETALITGGGSGLGFAIASAFVQAGAKAVIVGRRQRVLEQAVAKLGDRAAFAVHDVTLTSLADDLVQRVSEINGPVSLLVNNAGVHLKKPFLDTTEDEFRYVLETHVTASYALTRATARSMAERGHGTVLFIASMTSFIGMPQVIAYTAAKTAVSGLVRGLAAELSPLGVRVNAIAPGWIESPMLNQALNGDPERKQRILDRTPMGRFGDPGDIGAAAVYLCSAAGRFVTGVVLPVDGGASIGF